ncbi:MAG TPA: UDP-N-acetylmuramoyl-L-alanine--D-glutamate ligase [Acidimicrobiales bacterium]|jgi:UDP-N-acetylmuramoylalanine--D-glutamate ligase|nr:UDP-N-acetylmuramoyl-L-alanine--D-glutamate ligase [Acidimicrobiales bacterium]
MRPTISWSDLRGGRIGVWGVGVEGRVNVRKLRSIDAEPVLVDDRPSEGAGEEVLATDAGGLDALERCDAVVKTPGISRYRADVQALVARGVPVVGGLGLWLQEADRDRVVCVTGTKGKSTTTSIMGHLLNQFGYRCVTGGNLGRPPYDPDLPGTADFWVIETSSFQATDVAASPRVVAVTSLHPDHLDWHGDAETYFRDKLSLCSQPGAAITIANGDSELLRAHAGLLGPRTVWVGAADVGGWSDALGLRGAHNRGNAAVAVAALCELGIAAATDDRALRDAARGFEPLPSRLHTIGIVDGVEFVDDSLSTNVLPSLSALAAFSDRPVALIVGGYDRGIDYAPLADGMSSRMAPTLVLTIPDSGPRIHATLDDHPSSTAGAGTLEVRNCADLAAAVHAAFTWASTDAPPRGVVLLSPAAPSFGHFRDYRDRADAFAAEMRACRTP